MANAELTIGEKSYELGIFEGTEGEKSIDISTLRSTTGFITLDPGFQNTGSCRSAITFINGEEGILRYRGYPIEELGLQSSFLEVAYLLIYGELPSDDEFASFTKLVDDNSLIHENMHGFFNTLPSSAHPMAILSSTVNMLSIYYPSFFVEDNKPETFELMAAKLLSTIRTIAAFSYKKSIGEPLVYPMPNMSYTSNFLNMMFSKPNSPHEVDPDVETALEMLLILHADHEQNCSTSTVRLVGSSKVNLFSSICAGICALWGRLHGGANQEVIEMLEQIHRQGLSVKDCINLAKDKESPFRLMGFGHRVYKNFDPRAKMVKEMCRKLLTKKNVKDPLFEIAQRGFLQRTHIPGDRDSDGHVYGDVRNGPDARLDSPLERDARQRSV